MDKNGNKQFLEGFECPECHQHESFIIEATATVTVYDDLIGDDDGFEWGYDSYCACNICTFDGKITDFRIRQKPELIATEEEML